MVFVRDDLMIMHRTHFQHYTVRCGACAVLVQLEEFSRVGYFLRCKSLDAVRVSLAIVVMLQ